jgi:hypothetical protein
MHRLAALIPFVAAFSMVAAQQPQLRIVVLEGEGAVNIIQQKTAVKAVVEVRDRNNLPVSGASVTFAVTGKGGATVAGTQTVTVATNAAGQASLTGMTPASSGGLQLSVNATYNGLSAATTITQTVVATAAVAAAATAGTAAATTAATGAAAGGGLSTGALVGIIGGVAAVGGGVAVAGGGSDEEVDDHPEFNEAPVAPKPNCVFTTSPTLLTVPIEGGSYGVTVTVGPADCIPQEWTVTNVASFASVDRMGGSGNGSVTVTVSPFSPTATFPARSGAISIAGTVVNIHQPRAPSLLAR